MIDFIVTQTCDLAKPNRIAASDMIPAAVGDEKAHTWKVTIKKGDSRVDLSDASCVVHAIDPTGESHEIDGEIKRNVCSVTLPKSLYAEPGKVKCKMSLKTDDSTTTIAELNLFVEN